jgi:integrase
MNISRQVPRGERMYKKMYLAFILPVRLCLWVCTVTVHFLLIFVIATALIIVLSSLFILFMECFVTLDECIAVYWSAREPERVRSARDEVSFRHLKDYFGNCDICMMKRYDIRAYMKHRQQAGVKVVTVQRELSLLSAAINFICSEFELVFRNPVSCLGLRKPEPRVRWITREEARRLMSEAERTAKRPHLPVFIRLALNTGCRRGELLNLEWNRVNFDQGMILLEAKHNKSRRRRVVPLNDDALMALSRMQEWQISKGLETSWVFGWENGKIGSFKTSFHSALKRVGIEDFRIHDLRHTFASWLVMQGESIYVVRDLLGHASVKQTEIYAHLSPDFSKSAVQRMLPF